MTGVYKLLFDLCTYAVVSGAYLAAITGRGPSVPGFLLLALTVLLDWVLLRRGEKRAVWPRLALLALPLLSLLFRPGLAPFLQLLPGWAYIGYCLFSGRMYMDRAAFQNHFRSALLLLLLVLPALVFAERKAEMLLAVLPFWIAMLVFGVCLLRLLREETESGLRQAVYMGVFLLVCLALTWAHVPELLMTGLRTVYQSVLAPVLMWIVMGIAYLVYLVFRGVGWLLSLLVHREPVEIELDLTPAAEYLGMDEETAQQLATSPVLRIVGLVLLSLAALWVLVLFFRRLLGDRIAERAEPTAERWETVTEPPRRRRQSLTRPREPRAAVRWCYARFLRECRKRQVPLQPGMTSEELSRLAVEAFPGADPEALRQLYLPARYRLREPVSREEADAAAAAWRKLKRSKKTED